MLITAFNLILFVGLIFLLLTLHRRQYTLSRQVLIALILGAIGLYSVISYLVTQRTNEIGIRLALGARPGQVKGMIVLQGARLTVIGVIIGASAALLLTRLMQGILFGIEPNDPLTFVIVSGFLGGVAILATYLPANRASAIDPAHSLKAE